MLKLYEKNIANYLRTKTRFQRKNPIDILFSLAYGRVVATINDGSSPGWSSVVTKDGPLAQKM